MSTVTLPRPEHWPTTPVKAALGLTLFGVGGALGAVWAVVMVLRSDYLTAIISGGLATVALTMTLASALPLFGRVTVHAESDSTGTTFRPDTVIVGLFALSFIAAIPSGLLYMIFVPRGNVGIPMSRGAQVFSPYLIALIVLSALVGLVALIVRGGAGYVRIAPHGFEIANILFTHRGSWTDVTEITDEGPDKSALFPVVLGMRSGSPNIVQGAAMYTPRGRALYWMMRHYWLHPENRKELTDGRAVERLSHEDFDVE